MCLLDLHVKTRNVKNNRKLCYRYLNVRERPWKRWFSREGKHSTDDAKKGQVFHAFLLSIVTKMAADTTTTTEKSKKKLAKMRNEKYLSNL